MFGKNGNSQETDGEIVGIVKQLLTNMIKEMVDNPEEVSADVKLWKRSLLVSLNVAKQDTGSVIGRQGRTAEAIRTIMRGICAKAGYSFIFEISGESDGRDSVDRD